MKANTKINLNNNRQSIRLIFHRTDICFFPHTHSPNKRAHYTRTMHILIENDFIEGFGMDTMTRMKLKNTADVHSLDE